MKSRSGPRFRRLAIIALVALGCSNSNSGEDGSPNEPSPDDDGSDAGPKPSPSGVAPDGGGANRGGAGGETSGGDASAVPSRECLTGSDCVAPNDCSYATCAAGRCVVAPEPRGTSCSTGVCNGFAYCLPCIDDAPAGELDPGCDEAEPVCIEAISEPICVGCRQDSDCDDDISCTYDRCKDAQCTHEALVPGIPCPGGVCNGEAEPDSCVTCVDDRSGGRDSGCTDERPICDTSAESPTCTGCEQASDCADGNDCTLDRCTHGVCENAPQLAGTPCSEGYCNGIEGGEVCITRRCLVDEDCSDEADCTVDVCTNGLCLYTPEHAQCEDSGDVCQPNRCLVGNGCSAVDVTRSLELLWNGGLEDGNVVWTESSVNYGQVIFVYGYIPTLQPHSTPYVAWLGGGQALMDEYNSLTQQVAVPAGTVSLELSFYYQIWTDPLPDFHNSLVVSLETVDADPPVEEIVTFYNQDATRVWTHFSATLDATQWAGSDVVLAFNGTGVEGYTSFFVDTISLKATVCE